MIKSRKFVDLIPQRGLCNRLRAINAAISFSKVINQTLRIYWEQDAELGCAFKDLFCVPHGVEFSESPPKNKRMLTDSDLLESTDEELSQLFSQEAPPAISASIAFYPSSDFHVFTPVDSIRETINRLEINKSTTLGVHIRRTDHVAATAASPTECFIERMTQEISRNPNVRFFLATDCPKEASQIQKLFPDRVLTQSSHKFGRQSVNGMRAAVVDLFALSKCRTVLGSKFSSFSETASALGRVQLEFISR